MSNEHYEAPQSDVVAQPADVEALITPLRQTRLWVRMCSILGFISCGFMVVAALVMMVSGASMAAVNPEMAIFGGGFGIAMSLFYLFFALVGVIPSVFLHKYAGAITRAQNSGDLSDVVAALGHQKSFWKYIGVWVSIYLGITVLMILFAFVGGMLAAMFG